jgi:hypothetical protein
VNLPDKLKKFMKGHFPISVNSSHP